MKNKSSQKQEVKDTAGLEQEEQAMNGDYGHPETNFENSQHNHKTQQ